MTRPQSDKMGGLGYVCVHQCTLIMQLCLFNFTVLPRTADNFVMNKETLLIHCHHSKWKRTIGYLTELRHERACQHS